MSLQRVLEAEEWDILGIMTDPILLGEFLRNTADGSPTKDEWPKQVFKYRWYQRDLLSDKSEFISLVAGRAVGKCSPWTSRIYTYPYGYLMIKDLMKERTRMLYAFDEQTKQIVQRRFKITKNGVKMVYRITTKSGHIFDGTANHPLFTPRGWVEIQDIKEDDDVAVTTFLPHDSMKQEFSWEELRWLGYAAGNHRIHPEMYYHVKFQANVLELQRIATYFDTRLIRQPDGSYQFMRKRGPLPHYITKLMREYGLKHIDSFGLWRLPFVVKSESLDQTRIFLEAYFSRWGEFTADTITIQHHKRTFSYDIQELLLRYGIESVVEKIEESIWRLQITNASSYYLFFEEFKVPGVVVRNLKRPPTPAQPTQFMRFEEVISREELKPMATFCISVHDTPAYISDNLIVHNSLVLEDRIIFRAVNIEECFPVTKESTLVTANVSQMTPILDRLIMRLSNSFLLKDFLKGNINRSKGTMDFPLPGGSNYRINARIAGSKGENNMVPKFCIPMQNTAAPLYSNI